jgi:hypothetical protein
MIEGLRDYTAEIEVATNISLEPIQGLAVDVYDATLPCGSTVAIGRIIQNSDSGDRKLKVPINLDHC